MGVSRTTVLLIFVFLEVGRLLAAMVAEESLLHCDRVSTSIKPAFPSALLPCLLPGRAGGVVPLPSSSSPGRGGVSDNFYISGVKVTYNQDKEVEDRDCWGLRLLAGVPAAVGRFVAYAGPCTWPAAARTAASPRPCSNVAGVGSFGAWLRCTRSHARMSCLDCGRLGMKLAEISSGAVKDESGGDRRQRGTLVGAPLPRHFRDIFGASKAPVGAGGPPCYVVQSCLR